MSRRSWALVGVMLLLAAACMGNVLLWCARQGVL